MNALRILKWPVIVLCSFALLWMVMGFYAAGQSLYALATLVLGASALYVYGSAKTLAWRYLFPGVVGMLVFVAFPLLYTIQIGFTNYSSANLLTQERARAYLLDQALIDEDQSMAFSLHPSGRGYLLVLTSAPGTDGPRYVSPVLPLDNPKLGEVTIPMQVLLPGGAPLAAALTLKDVITHRGALMQLQLTMPQKQVLRYVGVREFGTIDPLWLANADGSITKLETQTTYLPNAVTGFFESATGERIQPGFKVGIGWGNYARLLFDADMRGPFISIFIWTVLFAGLTVFFATALGMTLAVVLNWEALKYRTLYRTLLFLPYAVPGFISILVFKGLFNQNFGEINAILDALFGVRPAWFSDPFLAKSMLLIVNTWLGYPYIMILCTGLIKAIPADLYEASAIAGAKPLTNFFKITVPLIAKPLTPLLISAFAFNFNNFVLISLLTDGRPDYLNTKLPAGTTDILVSYTYRIAFTDAGANFGLAAAISTLIFFMVALLSLVNLKLAQSNDAKKG
jgi:maltose/maltodextrin transport system permease protein